MRGGTPTLEADVELTLTYYPVLIDPNTGLPQLDANGEPMLSDTSVTISGHDATPLTLVGSDGADGLKGTADDKPITIEGPVVADGDVLIRGRVQGQGVIYAGRNVHVLGDVYYMDAPHWYALAADVEIATNQLLRVYEPFWGNDVSAPYDKDDLP